MRIILIALVTILLTSCDNEGVMEVHIDEGNHYLATDTTIIIGPNGKPHNFITRDYVNGYKITVSTHCKALMSKIRATGIVRTEDEIYDKTCELKREVQAKLDKINRIEELEDELETKICD